MLESQKTKKEPARESSGAENDGKFPSTDILSLLINNYLQKSEFEGFKTTVVKQADLDASIKSALAEHAKALHKPFLKKLQPLKILFSIVGGFVAVGFLTLILFAADQYIKLRVLGILKCPDGNGVIAIASESGYLRCR